MENPAKYSKIIMPLTIDLPIISVVGEGAARIAKRLAVELNIKSYDLDALNSIAIAKSEEVSYIQSADGEIPIDILQWAFGKMEILTGG
jgi:hypothetical protein